MKSIKFNSEMVNAILEGRKTQTRRIVKNQPEKGFTMMPRENSCGNTVWMEWSSAIDKQGRFSGSGWDKWKCPYGKVGDKLLIQEDWASRITLEITSIRVERLQDISRGDCMAEGCPFPNIAKETDPVSWFANLWESIKGKDSWDNNPWVWVIEFKMKNINNKK